ncbi:MAG: twin-arginine translocation signal domain-containing protein, partial [Deltaproteobacteria bacterium]|nr:twin-arginine translocation signal domain-containing protein [Deltaproteobacteria bacterium]
MKKAINRRQFLQTSGLVIAGAAVAGSTATRLFDPTGAWAISTTTLDEHTAMTLVAMCRSLYPHKAIEDAQYSKVVEEFDKKASADPAFAQLLHDGVASLDAGAHGKWLDVSDEEKLRVLKSMETTPFFQTV